MKPQEIINKNITILFSEPLNHLLISPTELINLFKIGDEKLDRHTFIEAPGLKVLVFPNRQKEIIFESNRLLINDKTKEEVSKSEIFDYLEKIIEKNRMVDKNKISAYGFNFDVIASSEKGKLKDFINPEITGVFSKVKSIGIKLFFEKESLLQNFQITPTLLENQFLIQVNFHYPGVLEEKEKIREKFLDDFNKLIKLVENLFKLVENL